MTQKSKSIPPPPGIHVPVPTFFSPSTSSTQQPPLDIQTQCDHAVALAKAGIVGLVLLGSTGEAIHLSRSERSSVISSCRKALTEAGFKDYPISAGVLTNSIDEAVEWLEDSKEAGAQWGLALTPGYFGSGLGGDAGLEITNWFEAVAERSPIPILM
jgi:2-keto-3-deoxy-L-rhamnonate aldolase